MKANTLNSISIILLAIITMVHTTQIAKLKLRINAIENTISNEVIVDEK